MQTPKPKHSPHRMTEAVRPAAEEPLPLVYTAMGAVLEVNLRNCDLAVEGSPATDCEEDGQVFQQPHLH